MMPRRARCSGRPWLARTRPRESASPSRLHTAEPPPPRRARKHVDSGPPAPGWLVANPAGCWGVGGCSPN
ncbi:hypothetical protein M885DRAFT_548801 [Pelagophyceae sp. CCMP2097]|nr:hypothetical protein M885DRAFT_548801 [Pelagophyceae sp. CCMP2097]